jgi:hypothetical protein
MGFFLQVFSLFVTTRVVLAQLGLPNGFLSFTTPTFSVQLVKDSQTLYSLKPRSGAGTFDFIPGDEMTARQNNGQYHLGDITFRARKVGSTAWVSGDSATTRHAVTALTATGSTLAAANLTPTLPSTSPLSITRRWVLQNNVLQLLFDVTNSQTTAVEIGALGIPLEFNNVSPFCHNHLFYLLTAGNRFVRFSLIVLLHKQTNSAVSLTHIQDRMQATFRSPLFSAPLRLSLFCLLVNLPSRDGGF